jgi:hypothetical protein
MAAYIGSITFPYPLAWIDKGAPRVIGSDTPTLSGNVVMLRGKNTSQDYLDAKLRFTWVPWSTIEALYAAWLAGSEYTADLEDTGDTVSVVFAAENGVNKESIRHVKFAERAIHANIEGTETDLYEGEINLIITG